MKPLTTFIIPTIKRKTLQRAIESANGHPIMVLHDKDRIGPGIIRQRMIETVKTPWVSFLDDDDTITNDYLERLREEIKNHPKADLIYFRQYWAETGSLTPVWPQVKWGIGIGFSVKTSVAIAHPFKSEPNEDLHFVERIEAAGKSIVFSKYITYRIRH